MNAVLHAWSMLFAVLLAALLGYTGLLKINDPTPTSDFLVSVFSLRATGAVRAAGFAELAIALWLISGAGRRRAMIAAALLFTAFAVLHASAASAGVQASCGCLGKGSFEENIPAQGWVGINASLAVIAGVASTHGAARRRPSEKSQESHATHAINGD